MLWGKKTIEIVGAPEFEDGSDCDYTTDGPYRGTVEVPIEDSDGGRTLAEDMYAIAVEARLAKVSLEQEIAKARVTKAEEEVFPKVLANINRHAEEGDLKGYLSALACMFRTDSYCVRTVVEMLRDKGFDVEYAGEDECVMGITVTWDFTRR